MNADNRLVKNGLFLFVIAGSLSVILVKSLHIMMPSSTFNFLSFLIVFIIGGGGFAFVGLWTVKTKKFFMIPLTGILLAILTNIVVTQIPVGKWTILPTPPEKAYKLISENAIVTYGSENIYRYKCREGACNWEKDISNSDIPIIYDGDRVLDGYNDTSGDPNCYIHIYSNPPIIFGRIKDGIEDGSCSPDGRSATKFSLRRVILLEDGKIMIWSIEEFPFAYVYRFAVLPPIYLVLGFIIRFFAVRMSKKPS
jgi:hypothetical protein